MNSKKVREAKVKVKRLILQYKEFLALDEEIKTLEQQKMVTLTKLAKLQNKKLSGVLSRQDKYPEIQKINQNLTLKKLDLQRISDEMSFANPLIWMIYKDLAYKGASNEISTFGAFKQHCSPEGYICTKRFKFLKKYLNDNYNCNLEDTNKFSNDLPIKQFYMQKVVLKLLSDYEFMTGWKKHEYLVKENKIAKWQI